VQVTLFFWTRSYQALSIMPCVHGNVPVLIVEWPAQVLVTAYGYAASGYNAPVVTSRCRPFVHCD
jgi:hypothetical protein